MDPVLRPLEDWSRVTPFGARFRDVATGRIVGDGLVLSAFPGGDLRQRPGIGFSNRNGVWCLADVPGLRDAEFGEGDDAYWAAIQPRDYRLAVRDDAARYLPFWLDLQLPVRGLYGIAETLSPPSPATDIPLFPSASRGVPDACAVIRAELRESASGAPAAWALLKAFIDGVEVGTGLADSQGRVLLVFAFPEPKRPPLTSPPAPISEPVWDVELRAFYQPQAPVPAQPELHAVLAQLAHPRRLLDRLAPPVELPAQTLGMRRELIVRSSSASVPPSPYLFIETA